MSIEFEARGIGLWRGDRRLCQDLSFGLEPGGLLQLSGLNGAGKTSLIRSLAGIGRLDEGEVFWKGVDARGSSAYRSELVYLGHHNGLKVHLSSVENYVFYQSLAYNPSEITAKDALRVCGLSDLQNRSVALLSMGQKRRAALARLLALRARLWLLDEPLASLDSEGADLVAGMLKTHVSGGGMAILVTHQPIAVAGMAIQRLEMGETA